MAENQIGRKSGKKTRKRQNGKDQPKPGILAEIAENSSKQRRRLMNDFDDLLH